MAGGVAWEREQAVVSDSAARTTVTRRPGRGCVTSPDMLKNAVGRLRTIGRLEGASFLVLLGIAMPLKYAAGMPMAVKVVGWAHGLLFVLYLGALATAQLAMRWSVARTLVLFAASLVPFGTFAVDGWLRGEERRAQTGGPSRAEVISPRGE